MCLESLEALGNSSSTSAAADNSFMDFTVQTNGKLCLIRKQSRFFFYQILTLLIFHCLMLLNTLLYSEPRPFENCTMIIILRVATHFSRTQMVPSGASFWEILWGLLTMFASSTS